MGIDVVIATYNRKGDIENLIHKLRKQCQPDDFIYVVFQNIREKKEFNSPGVKSLFSSPPNLPKARNAGINAGVNPIILFLDDDVIPDENLMNNHRLCYQQTWIGAVAGYVDDPLFDRNIISPSSFDPSCGRLIQNFSVSKSQYTISVMGANMSFRRESLMEIGGFDPCFKRNALWEDIDCAFRLLKNNQKIWFCSQARVTHLRDSTGGCREDRSSKYIYNSYANTAYFCCKYMPVKFFKSWCRYWKYRLEYETRIKTRGKVKLLSYNIFWIIAAFLGVITGILRFCTSGKRKGLPIQIYSECGKKS